jgi:NitT/TauT family transport system permease protein
MEKDHSLPELRLAKTWLNGLSELRGNLSRVQQVCLAGIGLMLLAVCWQLIVQLGLVSQAILPSPVRVLTSFSGLHFEDGLVRNLTYSLKLNLMGYSLAVVAALPLGFLLGLMPIFRGLSLAPVNGVRYLPLSAATGIFIMWFGIDDMMKVAFLAFSIFVYLVSTVIQRVDEVRQVYIDTAKTLGAGKWQIVRHVYLPDVLARVWNDVIVLVAISWTYIIIAELVNKSGGGVGALIYTVQRQSRPDKMFALLIVIMVVGFVQDRVFRWVGRQLFPYNYTKSSG